MPKFGVEIEETNTYYINVDAETREEACEKASDIFGAGGAHEEELMDTHFEASGAWKLLDPGTLKCRRCHLSELSWSEVPGYTYYCPNCDEDLYRFEVEHED